jgi:hypothetical protein
MVINRLIWVANLWNCRLGDFYTSQNCLNVHAKNSRVHWGSSNSSAVRFSLPGPIDQIRPGGEHGSEVWPRPSTLAIPTPGVTWTVLPRRCTLGGGQTVQGFFFHDGRRYPNFENLFFFKTIFVTAIASFSSIYVNTVPVWTILGWYDPRWPIFFWAVGNQPTSMGRPLQVLTKNFFAVKFLAPLSVFFSSKATETLDTNLLWILQCMVCLIGGTMFFPTCQVRVSRF